MSVAGLALALAAGLLSWLLPPEEIVQPEGRVLFLAGAALPERLAGVRRPAPTSPAAVDRAPAEPALAPPPVPTLRVTVRGPAGVVAGAEVVAERGEKSSAPAASGRTGEAELALAPGTWAIYARAPGLAPGAAWALVSGDEAALAEVRLEPGETLHGRVVDLDGDPVPGAEVTVTANEWQSDLPPPREERAPVGPDGGFAFTCAPGSYVVEVAAEGFEDRSQEVELPDDEPLELVLAPAASVGGTIRAAGGAPAPGAEVGLSWALTERADERGRYFLSVAEPGVLLVTARWNGQAGSLGILVSSGEIVGGVDIDLQEGAAVEGVVRTQSGAPAVEVPVHAWKDEELVASTTTGLGGDYRLDALPPGEYELGAEGEGPDSSATIVAQVERVAQVDLVVLEPGQVQGRVRDPEGRPVQALVLFGPDLGHDDPRHAPALCDRQGHFGPVALPAGELEVTAQAPGYLSATVEAELAPGEALDLELVVEPDEEETEEEETDEGTGAEPPRRVRIFEIFEFDESEVAGLP